MQDLAANFQILEALPAFRWAACFPDITAVLLQPQTQQLRNSEDARGSVDIVLSDERLGMS